MIELKKRHCGRRMAAARKAKGILQGEAALIFGVAPKTVEKWECGESLPSDEKLTEIACKYGIAPDYLKNDYDLTATITNGGIFEDGIRVFCEKDSDQASCEIDFAKLWRETYFKAHGDDGLGSAVSCRDGIILDLFPTGKTGYLPSILKEDSDASVVIGTSSYADAAAWKAFLDKEIASPFIHYTVFDMCHMPFCDGSISTVSDRLCLTATATPRTALKEAYRVLKQGGELVSAIEFVSDNTMASLTEEVRARFEESYSHLNDDLMEAYREAGFANICDVPAVGHRLSNGSDEEAAIAETLGCDVYVTRVIRFSQK